LMLENIEDIICFGYVFQGKEKHFQSYTKLFI
jgi:hypothetical protein